MHFPYQRPPPSPPIAEAISIAAFFLYFTQANLPGAEANVNYSLH
jgi:hypothetical protein